MLKIAVLVTGLAEVAAMSTKHGISGVTDDILRDAQRQVAEAQVEEEQLDMLDPISPEEMQEAREALGPNVGRVSVLRHARERKRGRPLHSKNRNTEDFARWLLQFGHHPAITLMRVQSTPPEILVEQSRRQVQKLTKRGHVVTVEEETLTYEGAVDRTLRAAEALMPYFASKKPVAVDHTINGVRVVEQIGDVGATIEGHAVRVYDPERDGELENDA